MVTYGLDPRVESGDGGTSRCNVLQDAEVKDVEIWGNQQTVVAADAIREAEKTQRESEDKEKDKEWLSG